MRYKRHWLHQSYQFGVLGCHAVSILNESLELVVLCEGNDLQHSPKLGENLEGRQHVRTVRLPATDPKSAKSDCGKTVHIFDRKHRMYLVKNIQGDRIEKVLHDDPEDRALSGCSCDTGCICGDGHASHSTSMQSIYCLQSCLGTLGERVVTQE